MNRILKSALIISFAIICFSANNASAQESAPSFQSLMTSGDREFSRQEYIKAKMYYQEALLLRPKDATAKGRLNKTLLAIREQGKTDTRFYGFIDKGDEFYDKGEMEKALAEYNKALKIKPNDKYATDRKKEVTETIKNEKEKLASFNRMTALGDKLLSEGSFAEAVLQFESALKLYPDNTYAKAKYEEATGKNTAYNLKASEFERFKKEGNDFELRKKYAEAIEAYNKALQIFPQDAEISDKISSLQEKKDIADRYDAKISEADAFYENQSYEQAEAAYQAALAIIPDDSYAKDMIARINEVSKKK